MAVVTISVSTVKLLNPPIRTKASAFQMFASALPLNGISGIRSPEITDVVLGHARGRLNSWQALFVRGDRAVQPWGQLELWLE